MTIEPIHGIVGFNYRGKRMNFSKRSHQVAVAALNSVKLSKLCADLEMTEESARQHFGRIRAEMGWHDKGKQGAKTKLVCKDGLVRFEVG